LEKKKERINKRKRKKEIKGKREGGRTLVINSQMIVLSSLAKVPDCDT